MRNQLIEHLQNEIPAIRKNYQFDMITTYQSNGQADSVYLGYQILIKNRIYHVYLPYMRYSEDSLIPLTPIWTVQSESENNQASIYRAYDQLESCLNDLNNTKRTSQAI